MRNRFWGFIVRIVGEAACTVTLVQLFVHAQARGAAPAPAATQARGAQAAPAYRAPRTGDGKPNLSGIWQSMNEANWNIEAHSADFPRVLSLGAADAMP